MVAAFAAREVGGTLAAGDEALTWGFSPWMRCRIWHSPGTG